MQLQLVGPREHSYFNIPISVSSVILNLNDSLTAPLDIPNCREDGRHVLKGSSIVSIRITFIIIINLIIFITSHWIT